MDEDELAQECKLPDDFVRDSIDLSRYYAAAHALKLQADAPDTPVDRQFVLLM
jgi:hypothetical protein